MKRKVIITTCVIVFIVWAVYVFFLFENNKTFFKTTYVSVDNQEFFIPKYSYFESECCMTAATFYSFKSEKKLKEEISNYMKNFTYFEDEHTYGYKKGNLFIQEYSVSNEGLYRKIVIVY